MNVFEAYLKQARRSRNKEMQTDAMALSLAANARQHELDVMNRQRKALNALTKRRTDRQMLTLTTELHPLELEAVKRLCPAIIRGSPKDRRKAWRWVMSQKWAEAWQPPKMEKRA